MNVESKRRRRRPKKSGIGIRYSGMKIAGVNGHVA